MSKLPLLLATATLALAVQPAPALARAVTPERILAAQEGLKYEGQLLINGKQRVRVSHAGDGRHRQEFLGAKGQVVDVMVSDGQIRWHFSPKSQLVRVLPAEARAPVTERLALVKRNYQFQVLGQARRANRPVVLTRFYPRHKGNMTHMLWVDFETGLPLAVERREQEGALIDRSEYTRIRYNPTFDPKLFRFHIPEGSRVASAVTVLARGNAKTPLPRGLEFEPRPPALLPAGYKLLSWQYFQSGRKVPTLNWRFHDGLNSLSLFAVDARHKARVPSNAKTVVLPGASGFVVQQGADRMMMWSDGDTAYTLVGHLPQEDFTRMAGSTIK